MISKRKWQEADWEIAMAAQSYVAVLAAPVEDTITASATKSSQKIKKTSARRSTRTKKPSLDEERIHEDMDTMLATEDVRTSQIEQFWLAQLQDDVTEDMLDQQNVRIHVTWLNKIAERCYEIAYDEYVDVKSILCQVYVRELSAVSVEVTTKSLARVQHCLLCSKAKLMGQDLPKDYIDDDAERPPMSQVKKRRVKAVDNVLSGRGKTKRFTKRSMAIRTMPFRRTVDEAKYEDRELLGLQKFESFNGDVFSANREVVRAVLTKNLKLLKQLTTDSNVYKKLSTFDAPRSADIRQTALQIAIDHNDLASATLLRQAVNNVQKTELAAKPEVALPSHSTGQHTSQFSNYNRRAVHASRGGREGNNALLQDGYKNAVKESRDYIWRSPHASVEMLTLLYPTGEWAKGYAVGMNVCHLARCGNYRLVRKMVEILEKSGGWGFNELHYKVLADFPVGMEKNTPSLPPFRAASAIKQAQQTRLRPLHLAAINPCTKFLEELYAVLGDEFVAIKDDQGYEPIHYAAACESADPLQFLLEKRCGLFGRTKTRLTPLMCALEAGRDETALAMLHFAAMSNESGGGQEVADKLVRDKGPKGKQAIHLAALHGCIKTLEYLVAQCKHAADVNFASGGTSKSTPLTLAAQNGHLQCVRVLLANGAHVNLGDKFKKTPLMLAVKNGHTRVAAALINGGADVNLSDSSENSVAHYAASYGWPSCLQLLCDVGAELWSQNAWGFVPLACALLKQHQTCAELLLTSTHGTFQDNFLNFRDRQGRTMLFLQCSHSHNLDQLSYLLDKGFDPNISDSKGEYPLQQLIKRSCYEATRTVEDSSMVSKQEIVTYFVEAVRLLLLHGAQVQYELYQQDVVNDENTLMLLQPLQMAIDGNRMEIVELLLDQETIYVEARSSDGQDACMTCVALGADGDVYLAKLLERHDKTKRGSLNLTGRSKATHENFFHLVANHKAAKLTAMPDLIRSVAEKCPTTSELMCGKDVKGYSPMMKLLDLRHERSVPLAAHHGNADGLKQMQDIDRRLTELVALFAEQSLSRDAFIRCEEASQLTNIINAIGSDSAIEIGGSGGGGSLGHTKSIASHVSSTSDSEVDDLDCNRDAIPAITYRPPPDVNTRDKAKILVETETALHLIARRQLISEPTKPWMKFYGCIDDSATCLMHVLLNKRPELFSVDPDDEKKSLVNVIHFGSFKTALHYAVESGDVPTVHLLLTHQANPNLSPVRCTNCIDFTIAEAIARAENEVAPRRGNFSPCLGDCGLKTILEPVLLESLTRKSTLCTNLLLEHGADVNCVSKSSKKTPLHVALQANDSAAVSALLLHGSSLLARDALGATPLHLAVAARHLIPTTEARDEKVAYSIVEITQSFPPVLVAMTSELNKRQAVYTAESAILVALKDPSAPRAINAGDAKNRSLVHYAAGNRDINLLQELLDVLGKGGASDAVNQRDWLGRTPLHYAVNAATMSADASFSVERFLLQCGADATMQDDFGFSALHFALLKVELDWQIRYDKSHKEIGDQKKSKGRVFDANVYKTMRREKFLRDQLSVIPEVETDPVETVSYLATEQGIMAQDALGRSPLHLAAATGAFVCVSTLLASIGDSAEQQKVMALQDRRGYTPLGFAVLYKRQTTIMTLLKSGCAANGVLRIVDIPSAAKATARKLISRSVSASTQECKTKTRSYFHHAVSNGLTGICHMLLSAGFCRRQAIEDAVRCGQFQLANNLVDVLNSDTIDGKTILKHPNARGETLLHSLAKTRQTGFNALAKKLAWALVDAGVCVDKQDNNGNIALHYASKRGNIHLMDFLHHQSGGSESENAKNHLGETPILSALQQNSKHNNIDDDQLLKVLCYFLEHPLISLEIQEADNSGRNVLNAVLDRFLESLAELKPVVFFTILETLLKRGVDPNRSFHCASAAALERRKSSSGDKAYNKDILRSGRELCEVTSLAAGNPDKMPPLVRVAITPNAFTRFHTLALLLRYGAKLSIADGRGNTLLMHLAARNLVVETRLALGLIRSVPDFKVVFDHPSSTDVCPVHVSKANIKAALAQRNSAGLSPCHIAVQPLDYGSYENTRLLFMLVQAGGDLRAKDHFGKSVIDYAECQYSRFVLRSIKRKFPDLVPGQAETRESSTKFAAIPAFSKDASAYLAECEANGKISRSLVDSKVNLSCDVGRKSKVYVEGDGTELNALLTKVDVKNGSFGLNVFYRLQLVHDELQDIYVLFTNWGRIGETGKFQNTPFRDEAEAANEFKRIFRSKTGNTWDSRALGDFIKKPKKYNLVKRVNYMTKVDIEVTRSIREDMESVPTKGVMFRELCDPDLIASPSLMAMLAAITDVRNLQLAAQTSCGFAGGDLPIAEQDELCAALEQLIEIKSLLEEMESLNKEIGFASGDISDDGANTRALLATRHEVLTEKLSDRSSRYYEIMPCQEDSLASSIKAFDQVSDVNVEITRIRMLSDIIETYKMLLGAKNALGKQHPLEYCYHALQVRIAPLLPEDPERQLIHRYFFGGFRPSDRRMYRISNVFEVERRGETQRFNDMMEKRPDLRPLQTHLLWHGTKRTNLMGILSQGLRIAPPEAPHHGYLYGKGLYFSNVAKKSFNYCDEPYALPIIEKDGKTNRKTRAVHYMLLCEVSLGDPTELMTSDALGQDFLPRDNMDSVKALALHNPDSRGAVVSPKCGAMLHLGRVMQVGRDLPFDRAWAKTEPNPTPVLWFDRTPKFTAETQEYLRKLVEDESFAVGNTRTLSPTDKDRNKFLQYAYDQRTIVIELLDREMHDIAKDEDEADMIPQIGSGARCNASLKVTFRPDDSSTVYSYLAKLYRNIMAQSPLAVGFTLVEPSLSEYAELIVYKEAQARIRYMVEVEVV
ncbi:putative Poly [ADP-ribose] polymerase, ankyrin repeat-containing domain, WGR domain superfamily [Plasmopara halstedii]